MATQRPSEKPSTVVAEVPVHVPGLPRRPAGQRGPAPRRPAVVPSSTQAGAQAGFPDPGRSCAGRSADVAPAPSSRACSRSPHVWRVPEHGPHGRRTASRSGEASVPVIGCQVPAPVIYTSELGGPLGRELPSPEEVPLPADPAPQVKAFLVMVLRDARVTFTGDEALQGGEASVPVIGRRVPVPSVKGREPSGPVGGEFPAPVDLPLPADPGAKTDAVFDMTLWHAGMADSALRTPTSRAKLSSQRASAVSHVQRGSRSSAAIRSGVSSPAFRVRRTVTTQRPSLNPSSAYSAGTRAVACLCEYLLSRR